MLICSVFIAPAYSATRAVLIGADLKPQFVNLQALGADRISYFDSDRRLQIKSVRELLQIRLLNDDGTAGGVYGVNRTGKASAQAPAKNKDKVTTPDGKEVLRAPLTRVDLVDGQRLVGRWTDTVDDGETLVFRHALLGQAKVKLDVLARLWADASKTVPARTPRTDTVVLANGDAMSCFVVGVGTDSIEVQIAGTRKPFKLPMSRVRALWLANPMTKRGVSEHMVWLRDGSRLLSKKVEVGSDKLTIAPAVAGGRSVTISLTEVSRIEIASTSGRLVDAAELAFEVVKGGKVFGLNIRPRVVGSHFRLHAPVTMKMTLPKGTTRFAAIAELDKQADRRWADCVVVIRSGKRELARHRLSAQIPSVAINVPIQMQLDSKRVSAGATLEIEIDPGVNGPVMDRVLLRDAMLFVKTQ